MQEKANTKIEICCGNLFPGTIRPIPRPKSEWAARHTCCRVMRMNHENDHLDSEAYAEKPATEAGKVPGWIKVGAIAGASALVGGLAAAWFYRKTLSRLRQAGQVPHDSNSGRNEERTDDEIWQI